MICTVSTACICNPADFSEADKLEEQEGGEGAEMALALDDGGNGSNMMAQVDERNNAVCVINATGTIQMANKVGTIMPSA